MAYNMFHNFLGEASNNVYPVQNNSFNYSTAVCLSAEDHSLEMEKAKYYVFEKGSTWVTREIKHAKIEHSNTSCIKNLLHANKI